MSEVLGETISIDVIYQAVRRERTIDKKSFYMLSCMEVL